MRFKSRTTSAFIGLLPMKGLSSHGRAPSLHEWNCVQLVEEFALHHPQPLLRHDRETTPIQCFLKSHFLADHIFHIPPKVSAVRRTIATEPWTLFACFLYTTISLNGAPWCNTGPKYSFSHTSKFFSRVVSASCSNPLSVSFSDWPPVITEWMNTLLPFSRKYLSASFSNM